MLDNKIIAEGLFLIATNFGFEVKNEYAKLVGVTMKDVSVGQFQAAVSAFMSEKNRYNMPSVAEWLENCGVETAARLQERDCYAFLTKVAEYISASFLSDEDRKAFDTGLSPLERRVLHLHGGIAELSWLVKSENDYRRPTANVIAWLRTMFNDLYRLTPRTATASIPMQEQIKKLTSSIFRKV